MISGSNDSSEMFRAVCLTALGRVCSFGDEEAILCLGAKLADSSDLARARAWDSLARLGGDKQRALPREVDMTDQGNVDEQIFLEKSLWAHVGS